MKKVKVIDLFNVKFEQMESKINSELDLLQNSGKNVIDVKTIGDSLNKCAIFVVYEQE